jgi:hypothetical protein
MPIVRKCKVVSLADEAIDPESTGIGPNGGFPHGDSVNWFTDPAQHPAAGPAAVSGMALAE